jgi:hypothetical protein
MRHCRRLIGALLLTVVAGLPVMALVCAQECTTPVASAASVAEHCHEPETRAGAGMSASTAPACDSPFMLTEIAARDRATAPLGAQSLSMPLARLQAVPPLVTTVSVDLRPRSAPPGRSPGARLPLRI